jgi:hypothetical protein
MRIQCSAALLFFSLFASCKHEEEAPVSPEQARLNTLVLLTAYTTAFNGCTPRPFVSGQTATDATGDPRIGMFVTPPSSFTFDDITAVKATNSGGFFTIDISLASIPANITINKSSLSGQTGIEYQWYTFFTKGTTTYSIGVAHNLSGSQQTVAFGSSDLIGVYQGTTGLGNCTFPSISGNTMTYTCSIGSIPALGNIDSSYSWYLYTINRTSAGSVQDCL